MIFIGFAVLKAHNVGIQINSVQYFQFVLCTKYLFFVFTVVTSLDPAFVFCFVCLLARTATTKRTPGKIKVLRTRIHMDLSNNDPKSREGNRTTF